MSRGYDEGDTTLDFTLTCCTRYVNLSFLVYVFALASSISSRKSKSPPQNKKALSIAVSGPELADKSGLKSYSFGLHSLRKRVPPLFY